MHYVLHVFHPEILDENELHEFISKRMEPFYEELEVEPYREYMSVKGFNDAAAFAKKEGFEYSTPTELLNWWRSVDGYSPWGYMTDNELSNDHDETLTSYYRMTTANPQGHWDWWVVGGRWSSYFGENKDTAAVTEALSFMDNPDYEWQIEGPYTYLTMEGEWISKETYNPDGVGYTQGDPNSVFPPNENYIYKDYLKHVSALEGVYVTMVDYHC